MGAIDASTLAVAAPVAALAAVGLSVFSRLRRRGDARSVADEWAHTMGTVISSTVQVSTAGPRRRETPLVLYTYQVAGAEFQGSRLRAGRAGRPSRAGADGSDASASSTVARYTAGSSVTVYYDPANPANSALEP